MKRLTAVIAALVIFAVVFPVHAATANVYSSPAWSPDANTIAVIRNGTAVMLFQATQAHSEPVDVFDAPAKCLLSELSWWDKDGLALTISCPNGNIWASGIYRIVVANARFLSMDIVVHDAKTAHPHFGRVSPDGSILAYTICKTQGCSYVLQSLTNKQWQTELLNGTAQPHGMTWTADGTRVTGLVQEGTTYQLLTTSVKTTTMFPLETKLVGPIGSPVYAGKDMLIDSGSYPTSKLLLINMATGETSSWRDTVGNQPTTNGTKLAYISISDPGQDQVVIADVDDYNVKPFCLTCGS